MIRRVAIVGAGLAGLACARVLRRAGCFVEVFEQDRIIGGRMATTRVAMTPFDHGAQYVTARSGLFASYIDELRTARYLTRWMPTTSSGEGKGQMLPWYVGTPGMSSIVRPLAEGVRLTTSRRVYALARGRDGWTLTFEDGTSAGPFHGVALTLPAHEAQLLLGRYPEIGNAIGRAVMAPCWSLTVRLDERTFPAQDVFSDMSEVIRWVARNNSKPGRSVTGDHVVIHASPGWSRETEDADPDDVASELWHEVCHNLSLPPTRPQHMSAHLWRRGLVETSLGESCVFSQASMIGVAGDWCLGRLAEHAFESGTALGTQMTSALF